MFMFIVIILVVGYFFVTSYNNMQRLAVNVKKCNANILSSLTKYSDTINKLQELLEGYVGHEKLMTLKVSDNIVEMAKATSSAMAHIQGLVQAYPDIKANGNYNKLMDEVAYIQSEINNNRITYNEAVATYNSKRNSIPETLYAGALGFPEAPFYDPENINAVQEFKTDDGTIVKEMLKKGTDNTVAAVKNAKDNISQKIEEVQQKHNENNK